MDRMTFNVRIEIGELLTLRASVNAVWRTSMEIGVRVEAERPAIGDVAPHEHRLPDDGRRRRGRPAARRSRRCLSRPTRSAGARRAAQTRRRNRLAEREEIVGLTRGWRAPRRSGRTPSIPLP